MAKKEITIRDYERFEEPNFLVVRLAGSGAGAARPGDTYPLRLYSKGIVADVRITAVANKTLGQLSEEDAKRALRPPNNSLLDLKSLLRDLYRFRPRWRGDDTRLSIIELERVS